jgi:hypothetical protein
MVISVKKGKKMVPKREKLFKKQHNEHRFSFIIYTTLFLYHYYKSKNNNNNNNKLGIAPVKE